MPAVDLADVLLVKLVTNRAQMQAKQSDVLETKLVAERSVKAKQFNETILADSETLLNIEATATSS